MPISVISVFLPDVISVALTFWIVWNGGYAVRIEYHLFVRRTILLIHPNE